VGERRGVEEPTIKGSRRETLGEKRESRKENTSKHIMAGPERTEPRGSQ